MEHVLEIGENNLEFSTQFILHIFGCMMQINNLVFFEIKYVFFLHFYSKQKESFRRQLETFLPFFLTKKSTKKV